MNDVVSFSMEPRTLEEAMKYAEMLSKSSLVPKSYVGKPGDILIAIQMGKEVGLKPLQALQNISAINGRPCIWGDAPIALVRNSLLLEDIREDVDLATMTATCQVKRKGQPTTIVRTFSKSDAEKARLWTKEGTWQTNPKRMLQLRARAFALRDGFSDVLQGLSIGEEVIDIEPTDASDTNPTALPAPPQPPRPVSGAAPIAAATTVSDEMVNQWVEALKACATLDDLQDSWNRLTVPNGFYHTSTKEQQIKLTMAKDGRKVVLSAEPSEVKSDVDFPDGNA